LGLSAIYPKAELNVKPRKSLDSSTNFISLTSKFLLPYLWRQFGPFGERELYPKRRGVENFAPQFSCLGKRWREGNGILYGVMELFDVSMTCQGEVRAVSRTCCERCERFYA